MSKFCGLVRLRCGHFQWSTLSGSIGFVSILQCSSFFGFILILNVMILRSSCPNADFIRDGFMDEMKCYGNDLLWITTFFRFPQGENSTVNGRWWCLQSHQIQAAIEFMRISSQRALDRMRKKRIVAVGAASWYCAFGLSYCTTLCIVMEEGR